MNTSIDDLKRQAKRMAKDSNTKRTAMLEQIAKDHGYNTWAALLHFEEKKAKELKNGAR